MAKLPGGCRYSHTDTKRASPSWITESQWYIVPVMNCSASSVDGSASYLVSNSVQLDGGANFGLNRQTPDVELYAGVSKRF